MLDERPEEAPVDVGNGEVAINDEFGLRHDVP
jgi:hypothetical protein